MSELIQGPWPRPQFTETEMIRLLKAIGESLKGLEARMNELKVRQGEHAVSLSDIFLDLVEIKGLLSYGKGDPWSPD